MHVVKKYKGKWPPQSNTHKFTSIKFLLDLGNNGGILLKEVGV